MQPSCSLAACGRGEGRCWQAHGDKGATRTGALTPAPWTTMPTLRRQTTPTRRAPGPAHRQHGVHTLSHPRTRGFSVAFWGLTPESEQPAKGHMTPEDRVQHTQPGQTEPLE